MRAAIVLSMAAVACAAGERPLLLRGGRSLADAVAAENATSAAAGANATELLPAAWADSPSTEGAVSGGNASENASQLLPQALSAGGWYQGGDKMWGAGSGVEVISHGNVGYYDQGMQAARARCGGAGCALIVNPPGHRTVHHFHIHFVHYAGYGASLKHRMEHELCHSSPGQWRGGHLPCGGRAAFFNGFPGVFSRAMSAGGIHHASVIAWPASCGGRGTIVELAYGCSIEHQIRGNYDPNRR